MKIYTATYLCCIHISTHNPRMHDKLLQLYFLVKHNQRKWEKLKKLEKT